MGADIRERIFEMRRQRQVMDMELDRVHHELDWLVEIRSKHQGQ